MFGLDSIMNKNKVKKSPSPPSTGGLNFSKPKSLSNKIPGLSSSPDPFSLNKPSSPPIKSSLPNITKLDNTTTAPSISPISLNKKTDILDLDKEIKSLEKGLNDDLNKISGMKSPQLPNFSNKLPTPTNDKPSTFTNINQKPFTPQVISNDPNNILNLSYEEIQKRKLDLLCKFDRLRSKGIKVMKQYNMSSDYEEMRDEYDTIIKNKRINDSIKWQRKLFITLASGMETFSESSYNPLDFRLTDFGSAVSDDIESYDDIFEELHLKYVGEGGDYPPELRLVFKLGTTAAWCIYQRKIMENSNIPDFQSIMKENPELNNQFKQASMNAYQKMNTGTEAESMGKFMNGMMSGGNNSSGGPPLYDASAPSSQPPNSVPNLDDILNSL